MMLGYSDKTLAPNQKQTSTKKLQKVGQGRVGFSGVWRGKVEWGQGGLGVIRCDQVGLGEVTSGVNDSRVFSQKLGTKPEANQYQETVEGGMKWSQAGFSD